MMEHYQFSAFTGKTRPLNRARVDTIKPVQAYKTLCYEKVIENILLLYQMMLISTKVRRRGAHFPRTAAYNVPP